MEFYTHYKLLSSLSIKNLYHSIPIIPCFNSFAQFSSSPHQSCISFCVLMQYFFTFPFLPINLYLFNYWKAFSNYGSNYLVISLHSFRYFPTKIVNFFSFVITLLSSWPSFKLILILFLIYSDGSIMSVCLLHYNS